MRLLLSNRGNSLVGVLVAAAVGVIVAGGMAVSMLGQQKSVSFLEDRLSKVNFDRHIRDVLSGSNACTNSLSGVRRPAIGETNKRPITSIRDNSTPSNQLYNLSPGPNQRNTFDRLDITSMDLVNLDVGPGPDQTGNMRLDINLDRQRSGGGVDDFENISLDLRVTTDSTPARRIASCSVIGGGGGGPGLVDGEMPCIFNVVRKTNNRTLANAYIGRAWGVDTTYNYPAVLEIFLHGEKGIKHVAMEPFVKYCYGQSYKKFIETYTCNNKVMTRTSRRQDGYVWGPVDDAGCGR